MSRNSSVLLKYADNLIFCNDSCYGPLKSFENIFTAASDCDCDFWGLSADSAINTHIQSFFYIFKKNVFNSKYFINYINNISIIFFFNIKKHFIVTVMIFFDKYLFIILLYTIISFIIQKILYIFYVHILK